MLVAITDRRLMVPGELLAKGELPAIAEAFAAAIAKSKADLVQVREKDLDDAALLVLVKAAMSTGAKIVVNDRIDVALAAGAYGVHIPDRNALSIADARAKGATFVGVSRHSVDGMRDAIAADLVQLGPIWFSPGKGEPLGPLALEGARAVITDSAPFGAHPTVKLIAVGGIETAERVRVARRAGADGVAAIRAVWSGAFR